MITVMKNYMGFISKIQDSTKPVLQQLLNLAKKDVRSPTGSNLRNILLLTNCPTVDYLNKSFVGDIMYNNIQEKDMWRVNFIK